MSREPAWGEPAATPAVAAGASDDAFELCVDTPQGRRRFASASFPLAVGGGSEPIWLDAPAGRGPLALLQREAAQLAIEPLPGAEPLLLNDRILEERTVLHAGDRLRAGRSELRVGRGPRGPELALASADGATLPPVLAATASESEQEAIELEPVRLRPAFPVRRRLALRLRPRTLALALPPLLALGALVGFSLRAVPVEIRTEPAAERVRLPATFMQLRLQGRYLLLPGTHRVQATLAGYAPLEAAIEVSAESHAPAALRFVPLPGRVTVHSQPEGAQIRIDGEPRGSAPLAGIELAAGVHRIRAEAERYQPAELELDVEGREREQSVELPLAPDSAPVSLSSEPSGAHVRVDGAERGATPTVLELDAGEHRLELELDGYEKHEETLAVQANQTLAPEAIRLAPARARVVLSSTPPEALVTLDGRYRGTTPLSLALEPGAEHELRLSKPGYAVSVRALRIPPGELRALEVALDARKGSVQIRAQPDDAELRVDGVPAGRANQRLELVAVPHQIEIAREGYAPYRAEIVPRPGFEKRIDVALRAQLQPQAQSQSQSQNRDALAASASAGARPALPARIETPAGPALVLVQPGSVELGSQPGSAGRRANETPHRAVLTRAFYIGEREISNREFRAFQADHRSGAAGTYTLDDDEQPAVQVSWDDAARFCNWLSARESLAPAYAERDGRMLPVRPVPPGYRLPTEAEWALAARSGGPAQREFPWGDQLAPPPQSGNYGDQSATGLLPVSLTTYSDGFPATSPVGSFPATPLGLYDIAGNAAEWIHDYYEVPLPNGELERDPLGPREGAYHVIRGSSWRHATRTELRIEFRDFGDDPREDVGIRIARYAE